MSLTSRIARDSTSDALLPCGKLFNIYLATLFEFGSSGVFNQVVRTDGFASVNFVCAPAIKFISQRASSPKHRRENYM